MKKPYIEVKKALDALLTSSKELLTEEDRTTFGEECEALLAEAEWTREEFLFAISENLGG